MVSSTAPAYARRVSLALSSSPHSARFGVYPYLAHRTLCDHGAWLCPPRGPRRRRRDRAAPARHLAAGLPANSPPSSTRGAGRGLDGEPLVGLYREAALASSPGAGRRRTGAAIVPCRVRGIR